MVYTMAAMTALVMPTCFGKQSCSILFNFAVAQSLFEDTWILFVADHEELASNNQMRKQTKSIKILSNRFTRHFQTRKNRTEFNK